MVNEPKTKQPTDKDLEKRSNAFTKPPPPPPPVDKPAETEKPEIKK